MAMVIILGKEEGKGRKTEKTGKENPISSIYLGAKE